MMKILGIDAWGNQEDGYDWNNWWVCGHISKEDFEMLKSDPAIKAWFRKNGYPGDNQNDYYVEDDGYNIVLKEAETDKPLYAIEYGPEYEI